MLYLLPRSLYGSRSFVHVRVFDCQPIYIYTYIYIHMYIYIYINIITGWRLYWYRYSQFFPDVWWLKLPFLLLVTVYTFIYPWVAKILALAVRISVEHGFGAEWPSASSNVSLIGAAIRSWWKDSKILEWLYACVYIYIYKLFSTLSRSWFVSNHQFWWTLAGFLVSSDGFGVT